MKLHILFWVSFIAKGLVVGSWGLASIVCFVAAVVCAIGASPLLVGAVVFGILGVTLWPKEQK